MKPKRKLETLLADVRTMIMDYGRNYNGGQNVDETYGAYKACKEIDQMLQTFNIEKYL